MIELIVGNKDRVVGVANSASIIMSSKCVTKNGANRLSKYNRYSKTGWFACNTPDWFANIIS